ncbi:tRNA (5-methylaminomethyl-2-thiouridine)(34)-methyltransferase MnmD [Asticcacaulis sp. AND118]|uniref:tRNA (5-methylaminomethyl-2-thiouridine)(34)-methyltransferase MnmD n=1 Tax=Asticcacaulis sp. AND118 TaxID=2840468 RepID=UPI001CFFF4D3|nr:tRNA (5-methylaminomethyl-2-thiouridine)(34)-methyltransferase MnmD [Asticcacaulis sp. AND118]UDF04961.1 tRNA (5-methylaminomethyl-2-thiouridine)(34)-methyltransferase MnmD [Asticcacaulis sp. AND118]
MTQSDPQLYFAEDGNPRSARFDDIYYSLQDGLSETRAVFLTGCGLPEHWSGCRHFTVAELGFGTGLNIAALMQMWAQNHPANGHLHIFSVEAYLMPAQAAAKALSSWPELAHYAEAIIARWPPHRRGFHVMTFPEWGVTLTLALMDVREALTQWDGQADAWFLDGFSPAQNPDMWAEDVLAAVAAKTAPGGRLATFTVAGFVRRGLQAAGFEIFKRPGFGRKRERLEAVFAGERDSPATPERLAVIGGGIAGASIVHALRHYGYRATVFDIGPQASGNPAGLVTPRLDAGGGVISALFADALYFAADLYARLCPHAVLNAGVLQRASDDRDGARFARIAAQPDFAPDDMSVDGEGLRMARALSVRPPEGVAALRGDAPVIAEKVIGVEAGRTVRIVTETGAHVFDRVFIACGDGIFDLPPSAALDLRPVRGQIERVEASPPDAQAQAWGGYYVPLPDGFVFGSTHIRGDRGADARESDRTHNLDTLRAVLPKTAELAEAGTQSRAAVRVTTKDHLPVMGEMASGVHVLTGLGARGLCLGPLLGLALASSALGVPSPLTVAAKHRLRPNRFSAD